MKNDIHDWPLAHRYCEQMSSAYEDPVLGQIERSTFLNTVKPFDASDFIQGRFLSMLSHLIEPKIIVEIGTFTAYAAVCLAEGLQKEGVVYTIEAKETLVDLINDHISLSPKGHQINVLQGKAIDLLPELKGPIDIVFMDAAKREYSGYFDLLIDKLRKGGLIIADNVLWKGEVWSANRSNMAESLHTFNEKVRTDSRVETFILPYRDGLSIMRKK